MRLIVEYNIHIDAKVTAQTIKEGALTKDSQGGGQNEAFLMVFGPPTKPESHR